MRRHGGTASIRQEDMNAIAHVERLRRVEIRLKNSGRVVVRLGVSGDNDDALLKVRVNGCSTDEQRHVGGRRRRAGNVCRQVQRCHHAAQNKRLLDAVVSRL